MKTDLPTALPGFENINRYWDRRHNYFSAKILPGEYYVTDKKEMITTVLGSCVSTCIRDKIFGIGGMNHFMLPSSETGNWGNSSNVNSQATRYGNYAMEHMINDILKFGGHRRNLEVKIFGGGNILRSGTSVGRNNIEFIRHYLQMEGFQIVGEDVGDIYPRKVIYYPENGRVRVKKLKNMHNETIITREKSYQHKLEDEPITGEIELF